MVNNLLSSIISTVIHIHLLEMTLKGCMQVGDKSYKSYCAEKEGILASLARRAKVSQLQN